MLCIRIYNYPMMDDTSTESFIHGSWYLGKHTSPGSSRIYDCNFWEDKVIKYIFA